MLLIAVRAREEISPVTFPKDSTGWTELIIGIPTAIFGLIKGGSLLPATFERRRRRQLAFYRQQVEDADQKEQIPLALVAVRTHAQQIADVQTTVQAVKITADETRDLVKQVLAGQETHAADDKLAFTAIINTQEDHGKRIERLEKRNDRRFADPKEETRPEGAS